MKVAVCCKLTPDSEDVVPNPDGSVDLSRANWGVSEYDLNAITVAAEMGAQTVAITVGGPNITNNRLTKTLMSHGDMESLVRVASPAAPDFDGLQLARVLADCVKRVEPDVVIFGEGSSDRYQRITGSLTAAVLGWPSVNCVDKIEVDEGCLVCERSLEDGIQTVEVQTPCVITVTSTINAPSIPTMKAVLAAGKKPVEDIDLSDQVVGRKTLERADASVPEIPGRQCMILGGTPDEAAAKLVASLRADGVL